MSVTQLNNNKKKGLEYPHEISGKSNVRWGRNRRSENCVGTQVCRQDYDKNHLLPVSLHTVLIKISG